jgi:hypothetical protein
MPLIIQIHLSFIFLTTETTKKYHSTQSWGKVCQYKSTSDSGLTNRLFFSVIDAKRPNTKLTADFRLGTNFFQVPS